MGVELLLNRYEVSINETGFLGRNCFLCAVMGGNNDIMNFLHSKDETLCKGKDINGNTALTLACEYGEKETVELLLEKYNAEITETDKYGRNCFLRAAQRGK